MPTNRFAARIMCFLAVVVIGPAIPGVLFGQPATNSTTTNDVSLLAEIAFWESVKDSKNPEELQAYIATYPEGRFAALARVRVRSLTTKAVGDKGTGLPSVPTHPKNAPETAASDNTAGAPDAPDGSRPGDVFRDCEVCPQLMVVPAGRFEMGSDDRGAEERPQHSVDIERTFALGVYEVTVDEWNACLTEGVCQQSPESGRDGKMPMANVSWDDAQNYLDWLSDKAGRRYRLPTEAEWEYATRAGTATRYWWGDDKGVNRANCADCGSPRDGEDASPVGSFESNPFGLYDVHGNVWEWTQDCWNPSYRGAPGDGASWVSGDCLSRVLRGGSWALDHEYMRSSRRNRYDRDVRYYLNGFRVASDLPALAGSASTDDVLPFEAAVLEAVNKVFSQAPAPASGAERQSFVIDPLIDGLSGTQSAATRAMESRIIELVRANYKQLDVEDFSATDAAESRYGVIGTFTGVNKQRKTSGDREAFRICLKLLDLESGKVVSTAKVFSQAEGVDITPTEFYRDSPVWIADPSTEGYIKTCQETHPGDPINPIYLDQIRAAALIDDAIDAYEQGQYEQSRNLFESASQTEDGSQLRTYNGLYLASWKLGDRNQAAEAFREIVAYGLDSGRLAVKFPFRPGTTDFVIDPSSGGQHDIWLAQIAKETARRKDCLKIVGHTRRSNPEPQEERLSVERAEYITRRLAAEVPELTARMTALGKGSEENLIGSGTGDARDALDERIEFQAIDCSTSESQGAEVKMKSQADIWRFAGQG